MNFGKMKFLFILVSIIYLEFASRGIQTHSPLAKVLALDDDYRNTEIEDNDEKEVDSNEKRTEEELEREEKKHESDVEYKGRRDEHKNSEGCIKADGENCDICVQQSCRKDCTTKRAKDVAIKKMFYKIARSKQWHLPLLNQTMNDTLKYFMFDEFDAHHFSVYFVLLSKSLKEKILLDANQRFAKQDFTTYEQYFQVPAFFKKALKLDKPKTSKYLKVPSTNYPYFINLTMNKKFLEDRYFVEMRLSGVNPMAIRRVTFKGKIGTHWGILKKKLNPFFNWEKAIRKVTKKSLRNSILAKQVYVVEFPLMEGIPSMPDLFPDAKPNAKMLNHQNPIAIFASGFNKKRRKYKMKVVAIQTDSYRNAPVYTPKDGYRWQFAKYLVQSSDILFGQIHEHLLRTHLRMEPLCVSMNRHLPALHPLHAILKFHCRGLLSVNSNGVHALLGERQAVHSLVPLGNIGTAEFMKRGFNKMVWNDFGLQKSIKERGMESKKKVPYFPYRDDGKLIDDVLKDFGEEFVNLFYRNDDAVGNDKELQNFINELSAKGTVPPNNGLGEVKGLPGKFNRKKQLANFVAQTLWIVVQHSATNNPNGEYGSETVIYPTKLYNDPRAKQMKNVVYMLPGALTANIHARLGFQLGSLHYDNLFDYGNKIQHKGLRNLVRDAYGHLMCDVKGILDARNARRFKRGHLTNPYMVPGWITNSVSY